MYLLDTNICSYLMKRTFPVLIERVQRYAPGELKISVITAFELEYGAKKSGRYATLLPIILGFLDNVEVLTFDLAAAREAGAVRAELAAVGKPIGAYDTLIAGHARTLKATLVTNNVGEFARVTGLEIENWVLAS